jgi:hypothetical protein
MRKEEEKNQGEIGEIGREISSLANLVGELEELTNSVVEGFNPILYRPSPKESESEDEERRTSTLIGDELYECNRRICAVAVKLKAINECNAL